MLNIYSASAGAGKTHRLTGDYLKMIFSSEKAYRHILAVTFTNKATEEMKHRILDELYTLSVDPLKSPFYGELLTEGCFSNGNRTGGADPSFVKSRARNVLVSILHDYSSFFVSTIDSFFQLIMRSFALEIGRYTSYKVELDSDMVIDAAIDSLYESLSDEGSSELLEWMLGFSVDSIERGDSWNIRKSIRDFAASLFSDDFRAKRGRLSGNVFDRKNVSEYKDRLEGVMRSFEADVKTAAGAFVSAAERAGVKAEDFKGGSKSAFRIIWKFRDGEISSAAKLYDFEDNPENWTAKRTKANSERVDAVKGAYTELNGLLSSLCMVFRNGYSRYMTASAIYRNIYSLGIAWDILRHADEYCRTNNIVLLSQSSEILGRIIGEDDAPFIYEKTGTWIEHYMLDEFQDTSLLQWSNFRPLLAESISNGMENLIVGDVKQSIYRWRGSDWSILGSKVHHAFDKSQIACIHLDENWRSLPVLVDFNNRFFEYAGDCAARVFSSKYGLSVSDPLASEIRNIYTGFEQKVPSARRGRGEGLMEFGVIPKSSGDGYDWKDVASEMLVERVRSLLASGYARKDIAVLVRSRDDGFRASDILSKNGYKVISEDSLSISSSGLINSVIASLRYLNDPQDSLSRILDPGVVDLGRASLPLYELCEDLISMHVKADPEAASSQSSFIECFLDMVLDYVADRGSSLNAFLEWWDGHGSSKRLSAPEGQDAIMVMTIHKAKGLGFKVCILPYLHESLEAKGGSLLWLDSGDPDLGSIGLFPVAATKDLADTLCSADYYRNKSCEYIDCLNLAYVALTRAKECVVAFMPAPEFNKDGVNPLSRISDLLYEYLGSGESGFTAETVDRVCGETSLTWEKFVSGSLPESAGGGQESPEMPVYTCSYEKIPVGDRLRLSLKSSDFSEGESLRERGLLMHSLLQEIDGFDDIERVVESAFSAGTVKSSEKESVTESLKKAVSSVLERGWFDGSGASLNEKEIITSSGNVRRPDRIVFRSGGVEIVDYKFGMEKRKSYNRQVAEYAALMEEAGYSGVKGYVWYVELDEIEQVR